MLHECDTCDAVFNSEEECRKHMQDFDHAVSSEYLIPNRAVAILSSSSMSSDSEYASFVLPMNASPALFEENPETLAISSVNDSGEGQGVSVPASLLNAFAESDRSAVAFTKQWVADQQVDANDSSSQTDDSTHYKCGACLFIFATWKQCKTHMEQACHWMCESCAQMFDSWSKASAHMNSRNHWGSKVRPGALPSDGRSTFGPPNVWPCKSCLVIFTSKILAEDHMNMQHQAAENDNINTNQSRKKEVSAQQLQKENQVHYRCGSCSSIFTIRSECEAHMQKCLHWICQSPICDRKFDSWNNASAHMTAKRHWETDPRVHPSAGYRVLSAPSPATTKQVLNLPQHRVKQQKQTKQFKCQTCNTIFKDEEAVGQHMKAKNHYARPTPQHRQFGCYTCGKKFISVEARNMHMVSVGHPATPAGPPRKTYTQTAAIPKGGFTYMPGARQG